MYLYREPTIHSQNPRRPYDQFLLRQYNSKQMREKNLGVHFGQYMRFSTHIDVMSKKVTGTLLYINLNKDIYDIATRTLIVKALAISLISYCSLTCCVTNKTQLHCVQKLQNFAIRVTVGARKFDHITPLF